MCLMILVYLFTCLLAYLFTCLLVYLLVLTNNKYKNTHMHVHNARIIRVCEGTTDG